MSRQKMDPGLGRMAHYYPTKESLRKALEADELLKSRGETAEIRHTASTHALSLRRIAKCKGWILEVPAGGYDSDDIVVIETMPAQHRDSHKAAGNWGFYPHNGAIRKRLGRDEAEEICSADPDGYDHIVGD
jgi:hypothetical protein